MANKLDSMGLKYTVFILRNIDLGILIQWRLKHYALKRSLQDALLYFLSLKLTRQKSQAYSVFLNI